MDFGCWGGFDNGESFENILRMIDFPPEGLESDGLMEDWDAVKSQCLGPIPSEEHFWGLPPVPYVAIADNDKPQSILARTSQIDEQPTFVQVSSANIPLNSSKCDESGGVYQATSPKSVLESSSSSNSSTAGKSISLAIPVRSRSKRVRRPTYNPWFIMTPLTSSSSHPKIRKDSTKKKRLVVPNKIRRAPMKMKLDENSRSTKKCTHCQMTKTPQWREGPMGPKTLCNACGVRYRSGRLFPEYRPAASPSFVPSLHSNSHRKVIQMRNKVSPPEEEEEEEETIKAKMEPPMSPPPEFVSKTSYLFGYM